MRFIPMLVAAAVLATAMPAQGQTPTAGWQDGFYLQSPEGDFRLQLGFLLQHDGRFALNDVDERITDTFVVRRFRPFLRARLARRFELYLNPDFAGGTLVVQDAYVDTIFSPGFRLRAGKTKAPFGMERLTAVSNILFFERASPTALAPNRDVGIQALGDLARGRINYAAAITNGVVDGSSADTDQNDGKELSGRVVIRPFAHRTPRSPLRTLGLGLSGSTGRQEGAAGLPSLRTVSLQQQYFAYSGTAADGRRTRYSPQVFYTFKSFAGWFEHVRTRTPVRQGPWRDEIDLDAWQIAGSWILTGEAAPETGGGVRPRASFDAEQGHWGALQVAARYHTLHVDENAFTRQLAAPGSSHTVDAWTMGLNWYLTQHIRYVFNFERTIFDEGAPGARPAERAIVFRTQVNF